MQYYPTAPAPKIDPVISAESYSRSSIVISITVPANSVVPYPVYGESFYFVGCTSPVEVATDKSPYKPYRKGTGENFPPELRFTRLEIKNSKNSPVQIVLWAGFGRYIDNRFEIVDAYTKAKGAATITVPGLDAVVFNGVPQGEQIQRKSFIVSNFDSLNPLLIRDENANVVCCVYAQTSITLPISGYVEVYNPNAGNITAYMGEIWYIENGT